MTWLWCASPGLDGDVRLETTFTMDTDDTIDVVLAPERGRLGTRWLFPSSWAIRLRRSGDASGIGRLERPGMPDLAHADLLGLSHDTKHLHRLEITRENGLMTVNIDGEERLHMADPLPLPGGNRSAIGIRSYQAGTVFKSLRISRLSLPELTSPVVAGDELVRNGHDRDALGAYQRIATDHAGTPLGYEALIRAFLVAQRLDDTAASTSLLQSIANHPARSPQWDGTLLEARALSYWRNGAFAEALDLVEQLQELEPERVFVTKLIAIQRADLPDAIGTRLLRAIAQHSHLDSLNLSSLGLTDLSPLAGMPLKRLDLADNRITDISPLAGMPLKRLDLHMNPLRDISAVRGMPLFELVIYDTLVDDLSPLQGSSLARLHATDAMVSDLTPLTGLPLVRLDLSCPLITDLSPLARAPLNSLRLTNTPISDLSILADAPLTLLSLEGSAVTSLEGLNLANLTNLSLNGTAITDLSPAYQAPLQHLAIGNCRIDGLNDQWIETLSSLYANGTPFADPSKLAAYKQLRSLHIEGWALGDAELLRPLWLESLNLSDNNISDLRPLQHMPLTWLRISRNPISDLGPLSTLPLISLTMADCPASDLGPLTGMPLEDLVVSGCPITDLSPLRPSPPATLHIQNNDQIALHRLAIGTPTLTLDTQRLAIPAEDWDRLRINLAAGDADERHLLTLLSRLRALATGDRDALRSLSSPSRDSRAVLLPVNVDRTEAEAIAQQFGAQLAVRSAGEALRFAADLDWYWRCHVGNNVPTPDAYGHVISSKRRGRYERSSTGGVLLSWDAVSESASPARDDAQSSPPAKADAPAE
jgi:Leucine-rich repeat (LRR) protein